MTTKRPLAARRTEARISDRDTADIRAGSALPLTLRQVQILRAVEYSIATRGWPPSLAELCTMLGLASTNGVAQHLVYLERKGHIAIDRGVSRGIRVLLASVDAVVRPCPHCGKVA